MVKRPFICGILFGWLTAYVPSCSTIGGTAPDDFPDLEVRVVKVDAEGIRKHCGARPFNWLLGGTLACPVIDFRAGTCTIYTMSDSAWVLDHERAHCKGFDHPGETAISDLWKAHKLHERDRALWEQWKGVK